MPVTVSLWPDEDSLGRTVSPQPAHTSPPPAGHLRGELGRGPRLAPWPRSAGGGADGLSLGLGRACAWNVCGMLLLPQNELLLSPGGYPGACRAMCMTSRLCPSLPRDSSPLLPSGDRHLGWQLPRARPFSRLPAPAASPTLPPPPRGLRVHSVCFPVAAVPLGICFPRWLESSVMP